MFYIFLIVLLGVFEVDILLDVIDNFMDLL